MIWMPFFFGLMVATAPVTATIDVQMRSLEGNAAVGMTAQMWATVTDCGAAEDTVLASCTIGADGRCRMEFDWDKLAPVICPEVPILRVPGYQFAFQDAGMWTLADEYLSKDYYPYTYVHAPHRPEAGGVLALVLNMPTMGQIALDAAPGEKKPRPVWGGMKGAAATMAAAATLPSLKPGETAAPTATPDKQATAQTGKTATADSLQAQRAGKTATAVRAEELAALRSLTATANRSTEVAALGVATQQAGVSPPALAATPSSVGQGYWFALGLFCAGLLVLLALSGAFLYWILVVKRHDKVGIRGKRSTHA